MSKAECVGVRDQEDSERLGNGGGREEIVGVVGASQEGNGGGGDPLCGTGDEEVPDGTGEQMWGCRGERGLGVLNGCGAGGLAEEGNGGGGDPLCGAVSSAGSRPFECSELRHVRATAASRKERL